MRHEQQSAVNQATETVSGVTHDLADLVERAVDARTDHRNRGDQVLHFLVRALHERGLVPSLVVGTSMGSLVGATWARGMPPAEMIERSLRLKRRDVFQIAHTDMALRRMRAPAVYRREPLDQLLGSLIGDVTFTELDHPLLINTVDINTGSQVLWGRPGFRDVRVADAVFASCALPGILPPREVGGRYCVDGAVIDTLPVVAAASAIQQTIIAVDVGGSSVVRSGLETSGFAGTYMRGRPRVDHIPMFAFDQTEELLNEGYRAACSVLDRLAANGKLDGGGVFPRSEMRVTVDPGRCVSCGICVAMAPKVFRIGSAGKAEVIAPRQVWSPIDGGYVLHCPTYAISAISAERPSGKTHPRSESSAS